METTYPVSVFIAYSSKDVDYHERLRRDLKIINRGKHNIPIWDHKLIEPGKDWSLEIHKQLVKAKIVILLISSDFISSDYCFDNEMTKALELRKRGLNKVIPVILRECLWKDTPLAELQALPKMGRPISTYPKDEIDKVYAEVSTFIIKEIREAVANENKLNEVRIKQYPMNVVNEKNVPNFIFNKIEYLNREFKLLFDEVAFLKRRNRELTSVIEFISYLSFGNNVEALGKIDDVLSGSPSDEIKYLVYENKARLLVRQNENKQVYDIGSAMIKLDKSRYNGYHWRGLSNFRMTIYQFGATEGRIPLDKKKLKRSLTDFKKSIMFFENQIKDRINLIEVLIALGLYNEAQTEVQDAKDHVVLREDFHVVILDCLFEVCNILKNEINETNISNLIKQIDSFTRLSQLNYTTKEIDIMVNNLSLSGNIKMYFYRISNALRGVNDINIEE